ncbi:waprin-Phi1-like [Puntigrus tetrazona]|uniref:waprin-Phi1-like n=1 Tax=Puntigrus tetrazona TaxID=1606681 RepID=UPI001C89F077|nr:waprin-Phi1-like [Puntigrus tetrazona]
MAARVSCSLIALVLCLAKGPVTGDTDLDKESLLAKPGICPESDLAEARLGVCAEMCSRDSDCLKDQKCCSNGCGHQCVPPYKEKPGVCPSNGLIRCIWSQNLCSQDGNCPDDKKCWCLAAARTLFFNAAWICAPEENSTETGDNGGGGGERKMEGLNPRPPSPPSACDTGGVPVHMSQCIEQAVICSFTELSGWSEQI